MTTAATKSEEPSLVATNSSKGNVAADDLLFDRAVFDKTLAVPALRVPAQATAAVLRSLRGHTLDLPRIQAVVSDPEDPKRRLVLLSPSEFGGEAAAGASSSSLTPEFLELLPQPARELLASSSAHVGASLTSHEIRLTYAHASAEEALKRLLPTELKELPSAFETVGHIAHLNLREELLPYSRIIGQVLLDKNPRIRTVVNKVASIQNEFRVFPMEVLAEAPPGPGGSGTETEVRQHGARFQLDFAQVRVCVRRL